MIPVKNVAKNALLGISGRSGHWLGKGSIGALTKENGQGWCGGSVLGREAYTCRQGVEGGAGNLWGGGFWEGGKGFTIDNVNEKDTH